MNRIKLTLACFLAYFALSGTLAPIGILAKPAAQMLQVSVADMVRSLGMFSSGTLMGSIAALFILGRVPLKQLTLCLYGLSACCVVALLTLADNLKMLSGSLMVLGLCLGVGLAQAALIISRLYQAERRASMLVATDASFSLAGFSVASLSVALLTAGFPWNWTYLIILLAIVCVVGIAVTSRYPDESDAVASAPVDPHSSGWPLPVWMLTGLLFFYTFGQTTSLTWLPLVAETQLGLATEAARGLVGNYWLGMFIGQLLTVWLVVYVGVSRMLVAGALGGFVVSASLVWIDVPAGAHGQIAVLWGICNFGLLKCVISKATNYFDRVPAVLVSSMLLSASFGTALSPWISSWIVEIAGQWHGLLVGQVSLGIVALVAIGVVILIPNSLRK